MIIYIINSTGHVCDVHDVHFTIKFLHTAYLPIWTLKYLCTHKLTNYPYHVLSGSIASCSEYFMYILVYNIVFIVFPSAQDPVTVSMDCIGGQDIGADYEIIYTSSSGTFITTCVVNGTDCSNGVCRNQLQNNITDSSCQPPLPQFSSENVTVTVTARNIVGRSNSTSELFMALLCSRNEIYFEELSYFVGILFRCCIVLYTCRTVMLNRK